MQCIKITTNTFLSGRRKLLKSSRGRKLQLNVSYPGHPRSLFYHSVSDRKGNILTRDLSRLRQEWMSSVLCLLYVEIRRGVAHASCTRGMYSVVSGRSSFQHGAGIEGCGTEAAFNKQKFAVGSLISSQSQSIYRPSLSEPPNAILHRSCVIPFTNHSITYHIVT